VWASVYAPSYNPPKNSNELVPERLPTFELKSQGNDIFSGEYDGFTEEGKYRIAIYAQDDDGLKARLMVLEVPDDEPPQGPVPTPMPMREFLPIIRQ